MIDTGSCNRIRYVQGNVSSDAFGHSDQQCFRDTRRTGAGRLPGKKLAHLHQPGQCRIAHGNQSSPMVRHRTCFLTAGHAVFRGMTGADVLSLTDEEVTLNGINGERRHSEGKKTVRFFLSGNGNQQHSPSSRKKKVAVLYISTGRYITFWKDFYAASKQYFLPGHDVRYFLFTDHDEVKTADDVTLVSKPFYPWPMETLRRFETS